MMSTSTFDPHAERPWSKEEDKQLRNAVLREKEQNRPVKWDAIATSLPRRSKKECRKRWHHTMMEAVRKCQWKPEEDDRLTGAVQKFGQNWTSVAQLVMTRNDNECMRRWNELQAHTHTPPNTPPINQWTFEEFRQTHPQHASVPTPIPSPFLPPSPPYSSPYGAIPDTMTGDFLHMSTPPTVYDSMDIEPSRLMHQENLDAFIDFDAERSGRAFEVRPNNNFDLNDWSWFDNASTGPNFQNHNFLTDTHPSELSYDSPPALDSGASSYSSSRSGSLPPSVMPSYENMDFYSLQNNAGMMSTPQKSGARVVIVCRSNDERTLNSLETIMKSLKASGHEVIQESQPVSGVGADTYLSGQLDIDDVLQDLY